MRWQYTAISSSRAPAYNQNPTAKDWAPRQRGKQRQADVAQFCRKSFRPPGLQAPEQRGRFSERTSASLMLTGRRNPLSKFPGGNLGTARNASCNNAGWIKPSSSARPYLQRGLSTDPGARIATLHVDAAKTAVVIKVYRSCSRAHHICDRQQSSPTNCVQAATPFYMPAPDL